MIYYPNEDGQQESWGNLLYYALAYWKGRWGGIIPKGNPIILQTVNTQLLCESIGRRRNPRYMYNWSYHNYF